MKSRNSWRGAAVSPGASSPITPIPSNKESVASLKDRLEEAIAPFTRNGLPFKDIIKQSLLTPSCSLASLTEEGAEQALELLTDLSQEMRKKL